LIHTQHAPYVAIHKLFVKSRGFARDLLRGDKPGGVGDGSPPAGSRAKPQTNVNKKNKPPV